MSIPKVIIHTDGGSRGNPGPGAAGYIIDDPAGKRLAACGLFLGKVTNNYAEYTAVGKALRHAQKLDARRIELYSDSDLLVQQLNGRYKVKSENIRPLYERVMDILDSFDSWQIKHIRREKNAEADALANLAMDAKADIDRTPAAPTGNSLRLGVLLSGGGRTMVNLQQEIDAGRLNAEIVVVISSRSDVSGNDRAREIGLEPVIVRRKDFDDVESFSAALAETLDAAKVDLVIQAGWLCLWHIPAVRKPRDEHPPPRLPALAGRECGGITSTRRFCGRVQGQRLHRPFCTNEYDAGRLLSAAHARLDDDDPTRWPPASLQECTPPRSHRTFAQNRLKVDNNVVKCR